MPCSQRLAQPQPSQHACPPYTAGFTSHPVVENNSDYALLLYSLEVINATILVPSPAPRRSYLAARALSSLNPGSMLAQHGPPVSVLRPGDVLHRAKHAGQQEMARGDGRTFPSDQAMGPDACFCAQAGNGRRMGTLHASTAHLSQKNMYMLYTMSWIGWCFGHTRR